ncbi:MAG TPA: hypothetical protein VFA50_22740 [Stellaceae bacterium]|nr:hypothetical protein [Stellaceae bacterium]
MPQSFRITYLRSVYGELEVAAESGGEAAALFEAVAASDREPLEPGLALTKPRYRILDIVAIGGIEESREHVVERRLPSCSRPARRPSFGALRICSDCEWRAACCSWRDWPREAYPPFCPTPPKIATCPAVARRAPH